MLDELEKTFDGEIDFTHPQGGLFLWGTMKSGMDSSEFFRKAISEKVAVVERQNLYADARRMSFIQTELFNTV